MRGDASYIYLEVHEGGTFLLGAELDLRLVVQVLDASDDFDGSLDSEKGSQVGSVGGHNDQTEEPPGTGQQPRGGRSAKMNSSSIVLIL